MTLKPTLGVGIAGGLIVGMTSVGHPNVVDGVISDTAGTATILNDD